jgi:hypothetical protein
MIYPAQKLIRNVQLTGIENPNSPNMDPNDILDKIADEQDSLSSFILRMRPDLLCTYWDLTLDGSLEYGIDKGKPRLLDHVFCVEDISSGETKPYNTRPIHFEDRFYYLSNLQSGVKYYIKNNKLGFPNLDSGISLRIWYPKKPTPLFYSGVASATANTVTLDAAVDAGAYYPEDDFYNGMYIQTDNFQLREITDFTASTRTFTVDENWHSNPTITTIVDLVSPITPRFQELLYLGAALRIKLGLDDDIRQIQNHYDRIKQELDGFLRREQSQGPQYVRKIRR